MIHCQEIDEKPFDCKENRLLLFKVASCLLAVVASFDEKSFSGNYLQFRAILWDFCACIFAIHHCFHLFDNLCIANTSSSLILLTAISVIILIVQMQVNYLFFHLFD